MITKSTIVHRVVEEMHNRDIDISYDVAMLVVNLLIEHIKIATSGGTSVQISKMGTFMSKLIRQDGVTYWRVSLRRSLDWRRRCSITKGNAMEKFGVEVRREDSRTKEAAERGKCPQCGAGLSGNPPICPTHGSEPFERRDRGEAKKA